LGSPIELLRITDDTPSRALTIGDLAVDQAVEQEVVFTADMINAFDAVARDRAPGHDDERFARTTGFEKPIIQGLCLSTRFSRLIGMYLPGEHAILEGMSLKYRKPSYVDVPLLYRAKVTRVLKPLKVVRMDLSISVGGQRHVTGWCQCLVR
jgi:acyl dehydratase